MFDPPPGHDDLASQVLELHRGNSPDAYATPPPIELGPWSGEVIEVAGREIQVRKPRPEALHAFSMAVSRYSPPEIQNNMVALFVRSHMSIESYEQLLYRMMDPDDTITMDHLGEVMRKIATLGTARPTGPSRT